MKTFSTILITGTFLSLTMILGNKEILLTDNEEIPEAKLEINFEELFYVEESNDLTLNEIPYEEIEEEMIIDFIENEVPEAVVQIDFEELFEVAEETELSLDEIEYLKLENELL